MRNTVKTACLIFGLVSSTSARADSDDIVSLLEGNDIGRLEKRLGDVQRGFESGTVTEVDLRNAYRPFYKLDPSAAKNLREWGARAPRSYIAHLALGIYYKRMGFAARGGKYISETPKENINEMTRYLMQAESELRKSLTLTPKPYLSIFHLLDISTQMGDRRLSHALLSDANRALPSNALARNRYAESLLPRWGGSYPELDAFIANSKEDGTPPIVILQLEAIKHDDMGFVLEESGEHVTAQEHFEKALQLGKRAGGTFSVDFLPVSRYYLCSNGNAVAYCQ